MKKTIAVLVAAATLGGVSSSASAVEIRGARSCGSWVEQHGPITKSAMDTLSQENWLVGYLSGIAVRSGEDFLRNTDNASLFLWLTNYCKANPLNGIDDGANDLYFILKDKK